MLDKVNKDSKSGGMRALSSSLSTIARGVYARLLGDQMNGKRNMYGVFGWNQNPSYNEFVFKYRRQGIARRIVNAPVSALWADPPAIIGDDAFNIAWNEMIKNVPVFSYLSKADKLAGLGRYSVLVIGTDDGQKLDKPVSGNKPRKLLYLQPYGEGSAAIQAYDEDQKSPRFGLPLMYQINPGAFDVLGQGKQKSSISPGRQSFLVHWTRVLHIAENSLESDVIGSSRLEAIYNDLDDLMKVVGGSAETYWLAGNRGLHVDVDKDMELEGDDADNLADEVEDYENELSRIIKTRGVKVKSLGSDVANPTAAFDILMSEISCATGIPKRELMGSEAGQLASQQDRANWAQRVAERISEFGQPVVMMPFIVRMIALGVLPEPKSLTIDWPDAFKMNPLERAQTSAQMARSAANLAKMFQTIQTVNHSNAVDSRPTTVTTGGGGFFGNADPEVKPPKDKTKQTGGDPVPQQPQQTEQPPLFDTKPETLELLTPEEARQIIGFGKHPPVFDKGKDTARQGDTGRVPSQDASTVNDGLPGE